MARARLSIWPTSPPPSTPHSRRLRTRYSSRRRRGPPPRAPPPLFIFTLSRRHVIRARLSLSLSLGHESDSCRHTSLPLGLDRCSPPAPPSPRRQLARLSTTLRAALQVRARRSPRRSCLALSRGPPTHLPLDAALTRAAYAQTGATARARVRISRALESDRKLTRALLATALAPTVCLPVRVYVRACAVL
jgi:hypothetical protein